MLEIAPTSGNLWNLSYSVVLLSLPNWQFHEIFPNLQFNQNCKSMDDKQLSEQEEACKVSRWQLLKQKLKNMPPEAFKQAFEADKDAVLIDVRRPEEFAQGHISGAVNLDYLAYEFWDEVERLDANKNFYVYCRSGRRSLRACTLMQNGGFRNVFHLDGGLNAWEEQLEVTSSN